MKTTFQLKEGRYFLFAQSWNSDVDVFILSVTVFFVKNLVLLVIFFLEKSIIQKYTHTYVSFEMKLQAKRSLLVLEIFFLET